MKALQDLLLLAGLVIQAFLVVRGFTRENSRICRSFHFYLIATFASSIVVSYVIKSQEGRRQFYIVKELGLDVLKLGVLLELNTRIFRYYPRVMRANTRFFVLAVCLLVLYLWLLPLEKADWWAAAPLDIHSKVMQMNCFMFFVFSGAVLFYRLHIDARHKLLLLGFLFSQFPLALGFATMAAIGERTRESLSLLNSGFFIVALLMWAKVYWRGDPVTHPSTIADSRLGRTHHSGPA
jgi:hypothetical protein